MADIRSVAVFGASGNIGNAIVPALLAAGLDVTAVTREGSSKTYPSGVKVVTADYTSLDSLKLALRNIDAVVSLVGPQGLPHQNRMIDAAIATGAKYFIPSDFGHDHLDPRVSSMIPAFEKKKSALRHLEAKEKDGLSWTAIITGLWFDWGLLFNMFEVDLKAHKALLWDGGDTPFCTINLDDIATAVTTLLTNPSARAAAKNKHVYISSFETTQNEILAAAEEVTGTKFDIDHVDSETEFKDKLAQIEQGELSAIKTVIAGLAFSNKRLCAYGEKADEGNRLLLGSSKKETLKETVKRVAEGRGPKGTQVTQH